MSERIPYKLDQLGSVGRGKSRHRPRDDASLYGGAYPFFQTGDVKAAEFYLHDYSQTYNEKGLAQSKLWQPGTLCITIAANIAETSILSIAGCFPDSVVGFVADQDIADTAFVKYYLDTIKISMQNISRGTTQDNLSLDKLLSFDLLMPPLPTQRRIASILSAYDDLIENNTRRIAILEEMARRLYEEWFVNFRFPGHETARFVETELGLVPDGWDVLRLDNLVHFNPRTHVPKEGKKIFVSMSALSENNMQIGPIELKEGNSGAKFQNGDTLFARITPCLENGKTGYVNFLPKTQPTACGSTEFVVLRSSQLCPEIVYCIARSNRFRDVAIKSMSGATGRQRVRTECLEELEIAKPTQDLICLFQNVVRPMFDNILTLQTKNTNLRAQRDLLLPKLISGELDVSDAEEIYEGAAI